MSTWCLLWPEGELMGDAQFVVDIHRHFDAPCELVYRAFIDEEQLAAWFGPIGVFVLRDTVSVDVRVGGHRRLTMVTESGALSWSVDMTFTEVIANQRLVGYETISGYPAQDAGRCPLSQEFIEEAGGTRLELQEGFHSPELQAAAREFWLQSFTKLDALLAS